MHPAVSIIFFTVTSGAGFGMIALLGLGFPMPEGWLAAFLVSALAGVLAVAGLISSTLHLGHPERALLAFTQWPTSWLSREGVLAVATMVAFGIYVLVWMVTGSRVLLLGIAIAALAVATIYSTAMIYGQLRTVPAWHTGLTPAVYLGFAFASALLAATAVGAATALGPLPLVVIAILAVVVAWAIKFAWWRRAETATLASIGAGTGPATGLSSLGTVRPFEPPHTGPTYLTREMVHRIGRKHARVLRIIAVVLGGAIPIGLALLGWLGLPTPLWAGLAFAAMISGLFVERWLFFAEAEHSVAAYYHPH